jgi:hypothetical protein
MSDSMPDPFEFLKSLWNPMGLPMPGMLAPTLEIEAVEKKIADLKSVENWLNLNLNMLRLSIQGLEMQRNTLAAMKVMQAGPASAGTKAESNPFPDPAAWWNMLQEAAAKAAPTKSPGEPSAEAESGASKPK